MEFKNGLQQILNDNKDKSLVIEPKTAVTQISVPQNDSTQANTNTQAYETARAIAEVQAKISSSTRQRR